MEKNSEFKRKAHQQAESLIKKLRFIICGYDPKIVASETGFNISDVNQFMDGEVTDITIEEFYTFSNFIESHKTKSIADKEPPSISSLIEKQQKEAQEIYNKALLQAQKELFFTTQPLDSLLLTDLKKIIYKNKWYTEFDSDNINNRQAIILFLYNKLQKRTDEIRLNNLNSQDKHNDSITENDETTDYNSNHLNWSRLDTESIDEDGDNPHFIVELNGKRINDVPKFISSLEDIINRYQ